ncbi:MAG: cyclophilin-like fold protein [Clostridia bacterium]|nr:cyclophilin-like fold protein [Clostridia bacterium]
MTGALLLAALLLGGCASPGREAAAGTPALPAPEATATMETSAAPADATPDPAGEDALLYVRVGDTVLSATLADNSSAEAFRALLAGGPLTIEMHDYGSFEKVGALGATLPRNDTHITTEPGDVILYQGNQITIYYDENTWSFTRLGRITGVTQQELQDLLGDGNVSVTFSLEREESDP